MVGCAPPSKVGDCVELASEPSGGGVTGSVYTDIRSYFPDASVMAILLRAGATLSKLFEFQSIIF